MLVSITHGFYINSKKKIIIFPTWNPTTEPAKGCVAGGKWQAFIESRPPPERLSSSSHHEFQDTDDMFSSWKPGSIIQFYYFFIDLSKWMHLHQGIKRTKDFYLVHEKHAKTFHSYANTRCLTSTFVEFKHDSLLKARFLVWDIMFFYIISWDIN